MTFYRKIRDNIKKINKHVQLGIEFRNPFELLIGCILGANARDIEVNKVNSVLFQRPIAVKDFLKHWSEERLRQVIRPVGIGNRKAAYIRLTCQLIVDKFNGMVPENRNELMSLPGVGRKIAHIVMNDGYGKPAIAVDTHVFRVARKIGWSKANTRFGVEKDLAALIEKKFHSYVNKDLCFIGKNFCHPNQPLCHLCIVKRRCKFCNKDLDLVAKS